MAHAPDPADEDALHWDGDDADAPVLPAGWVAKGRGAERVAHETSDAAQAPAPSTPAESGSERSAEDGPEPLGNAALIGLGMLGGIHLLYAIGWAIGGFRLERTAIWLSTDPMFQASLWLGILAPVVWFTTVVVLTRGRATWTRMLWLCAGVVLLVPWPFLMIGMVR